MQCRYAYWQGVSNAFLSTDLRSNAFIRSFPRRSSFAHSSQRWNSSSIVLWKTDRFVSMFLSIIFSMWSFREPKLASYHMGNYVPTWINSLWDRKALARWTQSQYYNKDNARFQNPIKLINIPFDHQLCPGHRGRCLQLTQIAVNLLLRSVHRLQGWCDISSSYMYPPSCTWLTYKCSKVSNSAVTFNMAVKWISTKLETWKVAFRPLGPCIRPDALNKLHIKISRITIEEDPKIFQLRAPKLFGQWKHPSIPQRMCLHFFQRQYGQNQHFRNHLVCLFAMFWSLYSRSPLPFAITAVQDLFDSSASSNILSNVFRSYTNPHRDWTST